MRIVMLEVDWKDDFDQEDITKAQKLVGGKKNVYMYDQDVVDSKVVYVSSHDLSLSDLDRLFEAGDLAPAYEQEDYVEGPNLEDIITQYSDMLPQD